MHSRRPHVCRVCIVQCNSFYVLKHNSKLGWSRLSVAAGNRCLTAPFHPHRCHFLHTSFSACLNNRACMQVSPHRHVISSRCAQKWYSILNNTTAHKRSSTGKPSTEGAPSSGTAASAQCMHACIHAGTHAPACHQQQVRPAVVQRQRQPRQSLCAAGAQLTNQRARVIVGSNGKHVRVIGAEALHSHGRARGHHGASACRCDKKAWQDGGQNKDKEARYRSKAR
eukprot:scaffold58715_cov19-Tisochrysis_lutea.AAC.1